MQQLNNGLFLLGRGDVTERAKLYCGFVSIERVKGKPYMFRA